MKADYTSRQGQFLAFIYHHSKLSDWRILTEQSEDGPD